MDNPKVNIRYAKALLDLSLERGEIERTYTDMALLAEVTQQNRGLRSMLNSPVIDIKKKIAVIQQIFKGEFSDLTMKYVELIIRKRRESHLDQISKSFTELYLEHKNIRKAEVTSVIPLTDSLKKQLIDLLTQQTGAQIQLTEKVDPTLLGGLVIKLENTLFDDSIRKKLQNLRREFSVNTYERAI